MTNITRNILSLAICATLAACGTAGEAGNDHKGHDHGAHKDHGHGKAVELGEATIGSWTVEAERMGEITAGKETTIELALKPTSPLPKAVRLWIGEESGKGSTKAKAEPEEKEAGHYHVHVEVPKELPAGARLWVSLEGADGQATKGSFALTPAAAK